MLKILVMNKAIERHLEVITLDNLEEWKENFATIIYAQARGVKIGCNGMGQWIVEDREERIIFPNSDTSKAIEYYSKLVRE